MNGLNSPFKINYRIKTNIFKALKSKTKKIQIMEFYPKRNILY